MKLGPLSSVEEEAPLGRNSGTQNRLLLGMAPLQAGGGARAVWPFWHEVSHGGSHSLSTALPKAFSPLDIYCWLQCNQFFWLGNTKNLDFFSEFGAGAKKKKQQTLSIFQIRHFFQGQLEEGQGLVCNLYVQIFFHWDFCFLISVVNDEKCL